MAIFTKSDKPSDYSSNVTTVSAGTNITGKIDIQCELNIDGEINADIISTGTVKIGQTGSVAGNLSAKSLIVAGRFAGDADCDTIELIAGGQVDGKLISKSLIIDASSSFQGESVRKKDGSVTGKVVNLAADAMKEATDPTQP